LSFVTTNAATIVAMGVNNPPPALSRCGAANGRRFLLAEQAQFSIASEPIFWQTISQE
jgi:hypothetical protein